MTEEQKQKVRQLRAQGFGYIKVSKELGISESTIKSFCRRDKQPLNTPLYFCNCCGKPVEQNPKRKEKKFCSDACRMKWWNSHRDKVDHRAMKKRACLFCGTEFSVYSTADKKYCSHNCYISFRFGGGSRERR